MGDKARHLDTAGLTDDDLLRVIYAAEGRGQVLNIDGKDYYVAYQDTVKDSKGDTTLTIGPGFTKGHPYARDEWFDGKPHLASEIDAAALQSYRNDINYAKEEFDSLYGTPSPLGTGLVHPSDTLSARMLANVGQMLHKSPKFTKGVSGYNSYYHTSWFKPAMKALAEGDEKALNRAFMNGAKAGEKKGSVRYNRVERVTPHLPAWSNNTTKEDNTPITLPAPVAERIRRRLADFDTLTKTGILVPFKPYR